MPLSRQSDTPTELIGAFLGYCLPFGVNPAGSAWGGWRAPSPNRGGVCRSYHTPHPLVKSSACRCGSIGPADRPATRSRALVPPDYWSGGRCSPPEHWRRCQASWLVCDASPDDQLGYCQLARGTRGWVTRPADTAPPSYHMTGHLSHVQATSPPLRCHHPISSLVPSISLLRPLRLGPL